MADDSPAKLFPRPRRERLATRDVYRDRRSTRWFMQHVRQAVGTADLRDAGTVVTPLPDHLRDLGRFVLETRGEDKTLSLPEILKATGTDAFLVLQHGAVVYEDYFGGMTPRSPHLWQSMSKSLVSCVAGNVIETGRLDPGDRVGAVVPELEGSAYGDALMRHLLDMQVGVEYSEDYADPDSDVNELDRIYGIRPRRSRRQLGSSYDWAATRRKRGEHGREFAYVSLDTNVLAWVLERVTGVWLPELIRDEVWGKLGGEHDAYIALDSAGSAQAESGVCASLRDLARLGLALCRHGELAGRQVVPAAWVDDIVNGGDQAAFAAADWAEYIAQGSYRDNFWVTRSGPSAAFLALGIWGQMLYVNPAADVVVAKYSTYKQADDPEAFGMDFALCEALAREL
jgi:CubicO group peptidase (beta-lactamase class C family)